MMNRAPRTATRSTRWGAVTHPDPRKGLNAMKNDPSATDREVHIRVATRADLLPLGRLGAVLVSTHHEYDRKRFIKATSNTESGYASFLATQLDEPETVLLIAERGGEVVGYVYAGVEGMDWMSLRGPAGVVQDLVVDPANRRQGIGGKLLEAALKALKAKGAKQVVLSTAERNEPAQRLFAAAGFRRTMVEMTLET
jgi:ribosomal protein S18 acetylase RimI-like enzyme